MKAAAPTNNTLRHTGATFGATEPALDFALAASPRGPRARAGVIAGRPVDELPPPAPIRSRKCSAT